MQLLIGDLLCTLFIFMQTKSSLRAYYSWNTVFYGLFVKGTARKVQVAQGTLVPHFQFFSTLVLLSGPAEDEDFENIATAQCLFVLFQGCL